MQLEPEEFGGEEAGQTGLLQLQLPAFSTAALDASTGKHATSASVSKSNSANHAHSKNGKAVAAPIASLSPTAADASRAGGKRKRAPDGKAGAGSPRPKKNSNGGGAKGVGALALAQNVLPSHLTALLAGLTETEKLALFQQAEDDLAMGGEEEEDEVRVAEHHGA